MTGFEPDTELVSRLPLPSHVVVQADGQWHRGWLIGREHEDTGWTGMVQYEADDGSRADGTPTGGPDRAAGVGPAD